MVSVSVKLFFGVLALSAAILAVNSSVADEIPVDPEDKEFARSIIASVYRFNTNVSSSENLFRLIRVSNGTITLKNWREDGILYKFTIELAETDCPRNKPIFPHHVFCGPIQAGERQVCNAEVRLKVSWIPRPEDRVVENLTCEKKSTKKD